MSGHTLRPSHHHGRASRLSRLADLFRGHGNLPDALDLQGDGDDWTEVLPKLSGDEDDLFQGYAAAPVLAAIGVRRTGMVTAQEAAWWGITMPDMLAPPRYVPDMPVIVPDPGPQADLGACPFFRDAVHANLVRQEEARGVRRPDLPWYVRYARVYRQRTGLIPVREPDFALYRYDHMVDEIVAAAMAAAYEPEPEAEPEASPEYAAGTRPETSARHERPGTARQRGMGLP